MAASDNWPQWILDLMAQAKSADELRAGLERGGIKGYGADAVIKNWAVRQKPEAQAAAQQAQQTGQQVDINVDGVRVSAYPNGTVTTEFGSRSKPLIAAGALAGGYFAAPYLFGSAAATGTGAGAGTGAASGTGAAATGTAAGVGTGTAAATGGGMGAGFWGPIIGNTVGGIFNTIGASKEAGATEKAAELQAQGAQAALDFQKQQYALRQQQLAPYLALSQGALPFVGGLLGINMPKANPEFTPMGGAGLPGNASGMPVTFGPLAGQPINPANASTPPPSALSMINPYFTQGLLGL